MEKSGRLQITETEFALFNLGQFPMTLVNRGVHSYDDLWKIIDQGEYEVVPG